MAKKALIEKNKEKLLLQRKFRDKRLNLKKKLKDKGLGMRERMKLQGELNDFPLNSSAVRYHNRCSITGRPRGYYRRFGISRIQLRTMAGWGLLAGVIKASW